MQKALEFLRFLFSRKAIGDVAQFVMFIVTAYFVAFKAVGMPARWGIAAFFCFCAGLCVMCIVFAWEDRNKVSS